MSNSYQDFGKGGASNSAAKLEALRLPADMKGMRFLDIGCNAGYFCIEAAKRGATCVGIEADDAWHAEAEANALSFGYNHECEFIHGRWGGVLPTLEEQFDIIIWTSAIHYERNQRSIMQLIRQKIKPSGTLIVEGGLVIDTTGGPLVQRVMRGDGTAVHHYSSEYFTDRLMVGLFDCRMVGPSVNQVGDRVPRYVFHCYPHKPSFHIVSGDSGLGKTGYALKLARSTDSVLLRVDDYFYDLELHKNTDRPESAFGALKACFNQFRDGKPLNVGALVNHLVEQGHAGAIADMLLSLVGKDYDYVLEGYIPGEVLGHLRVKLAREGWKVWESGVAPVVK